MILKKPKDGHWYELLENDNVENVLRLIADSDFRAALAETLRLPNEFFTIAAICSSGKIKDPEALEAKFEKSGLFHIQKLDTEDGEVSVYTTIYSNSHKSLMLAVLACAAEYNSFIGSYVGHMDFSNFKA